MCHAFIGSYFQRPNLLPIAGCKYHVIVLNIRALGNLNFNSSLISDPIRILPRDFCPSDLTLTSR